MKEVIIHYNITEFLSFLKRKWKFFLSFNIIALIVLIIIAFILPRRYDCTVTILPPEESSPSNLSNLLQNFAVLSLSQTTKSMKAQIFLEILRSKEIMRYISKQDSIRLLPMFENLDTFSIQKYLEKALNIELKQSGLLICNISFATSFFPSNSEKQKVAYSTAFVAKKVLEGLDTLLRSRLTSKARKKRILIENTLSQKRKELDSIETELQIFREQNKLLSLDEQSQAVLTSAINIGSELAKAEIELQLALSEYEPTSPFIQALNEKVKKLRTQYERIQNGGLLGTESFAIPLKSLPVLIRKFTNLMRSQKVLEQVTIFLETQKYQESIQEQIEISSADVLDPPIIPKEPSSPKKFLIITLGLFISIIISLFLILFQSFRKTSYITEQ